MSMDDERDGLAAEYVLGTLEGDERAQADALVLVDPDFAAKVHQWERRLGELNVLVAPVEPPAPLWDKIKASLGDAPPAEPLRLPKTDEEVAAAAAAAATAAAASATRSAEIVDLNQRVKRWRGLTIMTGALAASFVGIVLMREYRPEVLPKGWQPEQRVVERIVEKPVEVVREVVREVPAAAPTQLVAVFQKDETSPEFVITVDVEKRMLTVRTVAAQRQPDRDYQIWIQPRPDVPPESLGLVSSSEFTVRSTLASYDPNVISTATYGISLEPVGGSPTGRPTSPAIHAKLLQVTPPNP
jgi:anti-sigma-K factor RskA